MARLTKDNWPQFAATRHTPRGSQFRIGTRDVFVDTPNALIHQAIQQVHAIEEKFESPQAAFDEVQKEMDTINGMVQQPLEDLTGEECDWVDIQVKELSQSKKPYNIQVRFDWDDLLAFLDTLAESDRASFTEKYQYIFNCRNIQLLPDAESEWIRDAEKDHVREFAADEINAAHEHLQSLQEIVVNVSNTCRGEKAAYLYYLYSKDFLHSLEHIDELLDRGRITACYRELRNIIEELAVALFYDKLILDERAVGDPYSLPYPTHSWFHDANNHGETIRKLPALKSCFSTYIGSLREFSDKTYSKKDIWDSLVDNLNVSLFIAGASTNQKVSERFLDKEDRTEIADRATETSETLLQEITGNDTLSTQTQTFAHELVEELLPDQERFWIKFPTGFLARQYVSKYFAEDLNKPYNRYSHFSHAYPDSWQIAPGSSILEYKLLNTEIQEVSRKIDTILTRYEALI